jgi:hypothetical protein
MKIGIMQPYFFPYIGYWQLINACDEFILFDDVQYIRHGWINRNRILKPKEGWQYITVPLQNHSRNEIIKNIKASENFPWKEKILRQIEWYKKIAPFYTDTINLIENTLAKVSGINIVHINKIIIEYLCKYLDIKTNISISSEQNFDYSNINDPGEWALRISEQKKADMYINPASGKELFSKENFNRSNIKIVFLKPHEIEYNQKNSLFVSSLSIIDVLMFNGRNKTIEMLNLYDISQD